MPQPDAKRAGAVCYGVATAAYQVEGGLNGPGEPANNWRPWEATGSVEPSGNAVGFFEHPEELLERAAGLGCRSFRFGLEWARIEPDQHRVDGAALARYGEIARRCRELGMEPLVTLHHFTHPWWLGDEFWLRPDAPAEYARFAARSVDALGENVSWWVTVNEPNILAVESWLFGSLPPGRRLAVADFWVAVDNLLAAHVAGYEAVKRADPDATVTTNLWAASVYEVDRMLVDLLVARSHGVEFREIDGWLEARRAEHERVLPAGTLVERALRALARRISPFGAATDRSRFAVPRRALHAAYDSEFEVTLDVLGIDVYDPVASHHLTLPGRATPGGRVHDVVTPLWDDTIDPAGFEAWLHAEAGRHPDLPIWVVENGMCSRVRNGRHHPRTDGWTRPRFIEAMCGAVESARSDGVPVEGYWHWSLVDNDEWGSYEPRFGLFGVDRHRGSRGYRWLETDAAGDDAPGAYREWIAAHSAAER